MRYAKIVNGKVNIIVIDTPDMVQALRDSGLEIINISSEDPKPQGGWTYSGGVFSPPAYVAPLKTVYPIDKFMEKIPKAKVRTIQAAAVTDDDINMWLFMLTMATIIDLNNTPAWFTSGLAAMVTESIFTQNQVDAFLEV